MSTFDEKATAKLSADELAKALAKDPEAVTYVQLEEPPPPLQVEIEVLDDDEFESA